MVRRRVSVFRTMSVLGLSLCVCLCPALVTGCTSAEEVQSKRDALAAQKASIDAAAAAGQSKIDQLAELVQTLKQQASSLQQTATTATDAAVRAQAQAAAAAVQVQVTSANKSIGDMSASVADANRASASIAARLEAADKALAAGQSPTNAGAQMGSLANLLIPGVPGLGVIGGLAYKLASMSKAYSILSDSHDKATEAISNIVTSIDALAAVAPEVSDAIKKNAPLLDAVQKSVGKSAVDAVQANRTAAPLKLVAA